jgi:hypothetical protein
MGYSDFMEPPEITAQRKAIQARMNAPRAPMYTPEQAIQRRADNDRDYNLGLLAQLSGDEVLSPVGGSLLKNAVEGARTKTTERGTLDPLSGKFTYDPEYLSQRDEAALAGLDTSTAKMRADWDRRQEDNRNRRDIAEQRDETRRLIASMRPHGGGDGKPNFEFTGYTPEGGSMVMDRKTGMPYTIALGPDGRPTYTPALGTATIPKNTFDKQVQEAQESLAAAQRAESLLARAAKNPKAFSVMNAGISMLPGAAQGWASSMAGVDEKTRVLRAEMLRDASMELNAIYGASQTTAELARASGWAPNASDDLQTTLDKLRSAANFARTNAASRGRGVAGAAASRSGIPAAPTGPVAAPAAAPAGAGAPRRVVVDY